MRSSLNVLGILGHAGDPTTIREKEYEFTIYTLHCAPLRGHQVRDRLEPLIFRYQAALEKRLEELAHGSGLPVDLCVSRPCR